MMTNRENPQILIVDDSPTDIQIMLECLRDEFAIAVAKSGKKALEFCVGATPPRVILLDVSMPEMDGYETCKLLKAEQATSDIEVIFVSANDTLAEKLKGYDVGGSDYLTKPLQTDELLQKVRKAIARELLKESLASDTKVAMDTAMTAIMDAGEQATVVNFLRQSFTSNSFEDLAKLVVDTTSQFDLANSIQIRTPWDNYEVSSTGSIPPLEREMFTALKTIGRIHQRGRRLILNFGPITQLIKNMPDDEFKSGRLRDHLAVILEGAVSRLQGLMMLGELKSLMHESNESILRVRALQSSQKKESVQIMDDLMEEIQGNLLSYGLTEEQEKILIAIVENFAERAFSSYEQGLTIDDELKVIADRVKHSIEQTQQLEQ